VEQSFLFSRYRKNEGHVRCVERPVEKKETEVKRGKKERDADKLLLQVDFLTRHSKPLNDLSVKSKDIIISHGGNPNISRSG